MYKYIIIIVIISNIIIIITIYSVKCCFYFEPGKPRENPSIR